MDLTQDKIDLIDKIIKSDRKYANNESLYDDFFNETCQRSVSIINTIENEAILETYLKRIVTSAIITVLKDSGRVRRASGKYVPSGEILTDNHDFEDSAFANVKISYAGIKIPETPEEHAVQKNIMDFISSTIKEINKDEPDKDYLNLYLLRYDKGLTQKEISQELGISQSEVSKRLYKLIDKVKNVLE